MRLEQHIEGELQSVAQTNILMFYASPQIKVMLTVSLAVAVLPTKTLSHIMILSNNFKSNKKWCTEVCNIIKWVHNCDVTAMARQFGLLHY